MSALGGSDDTTISQIKTAPRFDQTGRVQRGDPLTELWRQAPRPSVAPKTEEPNQAQRRRAGRSITEFGQSTPKYSIEAARALARMRLQKEARPLPQAATISGLNRWEGRVVEVSDETVTAELTSYDDDDLAPLLADFRSDLFTKEGRITEGDVIYVTSRQVTGLGGLPTATISARLRRLGTWTTEELAGIMQKASRMAGDFASFKD